VVQQDLPEERRAQGWTVPEFPGVRVVVSPNAATIDRLLNEDPRGSVHVFSGIHAYPMVETAFYKCVETSARMGLFAEPGNGSGWKGAGRLLRGRWDCCRFGRRLSFILTTGWTGVNWYRRCGYAESLIYPYGYFVETPREVSAVSGLAREAGPMQLMFLGQNIRRKGGDLLLRALGGLVGLDWRLTIMGAGPLNQEWRDLSARLGLGERVEFLAQAANDEAMERLCRSDLLVLPSRFDGWGAVVNEALMRGVPVITSDRCGAAALLGEPWRGAVFRAGSVDHLQQVLCRHIPARRRTPEMAERIRHWSRCIQGASAASYLVEVLEAAAGGKPRPIAPWLLPETAGESGAPPLGERGVSGELVRA
jgi:hypothetical protein